MEKEDTFFALIHAAEEHFVSENDGARNAALQLVQELASWFGPEHHQSDVHEVATLRAIREILDFAKTATDRRLALLNSVEWHALRHKTLSTDLERESNLAVCVARISDWAKVAGGPAELKEELRAMFDEYSPSSRGVRGARNAISILTQLILDASVIPTDEATTAGFDDFADFARGKGCMEDEESQRERIRKRLDKDRREFELKRDELREKYVLSSPEAFESSESDPNSQVG